MADYTAAQWRGLIQQTTAGYRDTPGGAPPWQIVEGMVDLESGGDPNNVTDTGTGDVAVGLGQITSSGLEYGLYRQRFPDGPTDLTDPQTNLKIMVLGLDYREEQGVNADKAGQPHALENWFVTSAAYFGAGSEEGINSNADAFGTTGYTYVDHVKNYMRTVLKLSDTQIDAIGGGTNTGSDLGDTGSGSGSKGSGQPTSYGFGDIPGASAVSNAITGLDSLLFKGLERGLIAAIGLALLGYGLYSVVKAS